MSGNAPLTAETVDSRAVVGRVCDPPCIFYELKSCMCAHLEAGGYVKHFGAPSTPLREVLAEALHDAQYPMIPGVHDHTAAAVEAHANAGRRRYMRDPAFRNRVDRTEAIVRLAFSASAVHSQPEKT